MRLHTLRQQVGRGFIVGGVGCRKCFPRCPRDGFLANHQRSNHVFGRLVARCFLDTCETNELGIGTWRPHTQRPDALRDIVDALEAERISSADVPRFVIEYLESLG